MADIEFEQLVNDRGRSVLNTALRVLGNVEAAQDVYQEVFLSIWRRWHKFNGEVRWSGYLYRTTIRCAIDHARKQRKLSTFDPNNVTIESKNSPDESMKAVELGHKLAVHLAELPKNQAEVFVLSRIEGLSHEEIAEMLGFSRSTAAVHLHRALKRLGHDFRDYVK